MIKLNFEKVCFFYLQIEIRKHETHEDFLTKIIKFEIHILKTLSSISIPTFYG